MTKTYLTDLNDNHRQPKVKNPPNKRRAMFHGRVENVPINFIAYNLLRHPGPSSNRSTAAD